MADQLEPVLVVIPTYNERDNIESIVARLHAALPKAHVLVVDDGSPDGTGDIADELAKNDADGRVHVMHRTEKNGLGAAYVAGFRWGLDRDYAVLVEMDADGSHAPEDLPRLLDALTDADLVIGSRYVPGGKVVNWPKRRVLPVLGRQRLLAARARREGQGHHRRVPRLPAGGAGEDPHRQRGLAGLLLPDRPRLAHDRGRLHRGRGADHVHRAGARPVEDVRRHHPRGAAPGDEVGPAPPRHPGPPAVPGAGV